MSNKKARIVVVGPVPPPVHGVTISTRRILNSKMKERYDILHLDTSDHRTVGNIGALDIMNFVLAFQSYWRLLLICFRSSPDVVYVPISQTFVGFFRDAFYIIVPRLFGAKVVIHLRGGYFGSFYEQSNAVVRFGVDIVMRFVNRVLVLGDVLRPIFHRWIPDERIDVAPNGTDLVFQDVPAKLDMARSAKVFTYMSSLMRTKGLVEYVQAALAVLEDHPDCTFNIGGEWWSQEPDLRPEIESLLAASPHKDQVVFHGLVTGDDKINLLYHSDVFVLPTYYPFEGHPNAIIESMAAGCTVVSTDHAAIPETVLHQQTGLIVEKKDPQSLEDAFRFLIDNAETFRAYAAASYERYTQEYTAEKNVERIGDSFHRAISRG